MANPDRQKLMRRDFLKSVLAKIPALSLDWDSFSRGDAGRRACHDGSEAAAPDGPWNTADQRPQHGQLPGGGYGAVIPSGLQCFGEIMQDWKS